MTVAYPSPGELSPALVALDGERARRPAPLLPRHLWERALFGPAEEFLRRPGKAFRARLIQACHALAGGDARGPDPRASLCVELLHAGSLIVDDIEDGSEERRGAPALHRLVGVPRALNTGNWMYFWALEQLGELPLSAESREELLRAAHRCLVRCHQGQALDLSVPVWDLSPGEVPQVARTITDLKTGALMGFAARLGAVDAGADAATVDALVRFGTQMGIGLQMLDDLGGVRRASRMDKGLEDLRHGRVTWVWAWAAQVSDGLGFRQLQQRAQRSEQPEQLLQQLGEAVAVWGRARVRARLGDALDRLRDELGTSPAWHALANELARLEKSYG